LVEANPTIATENPVEGAEARDRTPTPEEIRSIWSACGDDDFGRIVRLLLLTGARRDEIGGLKWSEVNMETAVMTIPGERTKNGRDLVLTLPPMAMEIIASAPHRAGREYLFGNRGGAFSAWSYNTLAFNSKITTAEGAPLEAWRLHDLRRTLSTGMHELGVQPHIVEAVLNHVGGHKGGVAGTYNKATYEREIGAALALWADHIRTLIEGGERKVVALHRGVA
jgi:integrase